MCLRIHWHHLLGLCPPWCNFNNVINPSFAIWIFACLGSLGKNPPDWCISFWISNHWNLDVKVTLTFALVPNGHIFLWKAEMPLEFSGHWERNLTRGLSLIILHLWWPVHLVASGMGAFDSSAFISYSRFFVVHRWASICFASRFTYRNSLSLWGWSGQEKGSWVWEAATFFLLVELCQSDTSALHWPPLFSSDSSGLHRPSTSAFDSSAFISYSRFFVVHRWASICFASRFTYRNSLSLWGWSGQEKGSWVWEAATYIYYII